MGVLNSKKEIDKNIIDCGETFNIKLSLTAAPNIINNPTDIVLVLDSSNSMTGTPMANLKRAAKKFVEIIDGSTDTTLDGEIGNGSHIGVVGFSSVAVQKTQLITSVSSLNNAIGSLFPNGLTNHADAFKKAVDLFDSNSNNNKVIVLFTDGITTTGEAPGPIAEAAKRHGIIIYCIGLVSGDGLDVNHLNEWSSDPDSSYVSVTSDSAALEDLFMDLAKNISKAGATNIEITDTINSCFKINNVIRVTKGSANILDDNSIKWNIDELGVLGNEGAILEFSATHIGDAKGEVIVNTNTEYHDDEGNEVIFKSPTINIECINPVIVEECNNPIDLSIDGCNNNAVYDLGDVHLDSLGRILQLSLTLKNICPNKRVALAIMLSEVDDNEIEYDRGIRTMLIPAHLGESCQDIEVKCIDFVLPEELDVTGDINSICNERKFKVRVISHYVDSNYFFNDNIRN